MPEWASLFMGFIKGNVSIGRFMILITLAILFWSLTPDFIVGGINSRPIPFLPNGSNFAIICVSGSFVLMIFYDAALRPIIGWCIDKIKVINALKNIKNLSSEEKDILGYYVRSGSELRFINGAENATVSLLNKNIIKNIGTNDPLSGIYAYQVNPIYKKAMMSYMSKTSNSP